MATVVKLKFLKMNNKQWTKKEIKARGIKILEFMKEKWFLDMGSNNIKELATIYDLDNQ